MPDLEGTIWQRYRERGDLLVYGIHPGDPPGLVAAFVEQTGITFPVVEDNGTLRLFAFPPGIPYPYPRDVVVGKDGTIRSIRSSFDVQEMDALVRRLLEE